jgi:histidinol-phosphate phosphatase family protein
MRKAVFLDKDGVINLLIERKDYPDGHVTSPWTLEEFKDSMFPYVRECVSRLKDMGFMVFVVTNQPGVLDGNMHMTELDNICGYLEDEMGVDHVLYAMRKESNLYKPNNGMIEALVRTYHVDRNNSYMVGDRWKDIVPGNKSGLTTILVNSFYQYTPSEEHIDMSVPDHISTNLIGAVDIIEKMESDNGVRGRK